MHEIDTIERRSILRRLLQREPFQPITNIMHDEESKEPAVVEEWLLRYNTRVPGMICGFSVPA